MTAPIPLPRQMDRAGRRGALLAVALFALAGCGGGGGGGDTPAPTPNPTPTPTGDTVISGKVTFDRVPHNANNGLDYDNTRADPVRGVTVQALSASGAVLATTETDENGDYSVTVDEGTQVRMRVRAELVQSGTPSWNFIVVDNTANDALYVLDGALTAAAGETQTRDLLAASGWGGSSYTGERAAAPFAILDSVYEAVTDVLAVDGTLQFPQLTLHWSENNRPQSGDPSNGDITTSFYTRDNQGNSEIFLLGAANVDTDEYDRHVVIHEWGHYFEDRFSRSDSMGGPHSGGDRLDPRIAFSEGFGYALAGMVTDDPRASDSLGSGQAVGFAIDVETDNLTANPGGNLNPGWFSEGSIWLILYDLYDANADAVDTVSLGLGPIIEALRSTAFADGSAATTIFSFADALRTQQPSATTGLDALLNAKDIVGSGNDRYGSAETNDASDTRGLPITFDPADILPVYTSIAPDGTPQVVCSNGGELSTDFGVFNKLANRQLLRFTVASAGRYRMSVTGTQDPDIALFQGDFLAVAQTLGNDSIDRDLTPGEYLLEVYDYANLRPDDAPHAPGRYCLTVTVLPI